MILKINGDIVSNDWKMIYDWFGIDCTVPKDVVTACLLYTSPSPRDS